MPFSISAGAEKLLHVTEFPPDHSQDSPPDKNATVRTCLLFLRLHHPQLFPSDDLLYFAQKLSGVLFAPLVENDASKNRILGVVALCERKLLDADTLDMAVYTEGGKLAIIALYVVSPSHRAAFLDRLREIPLAEIRQLFAVLATIQPHESFTKYIDENITDHQVNS